MRRFSHRPLGGLSSTHLLFLAALASMALTARLGWWQLDRAAQKESQQALLAQREALPALDLSGSVFPGADDLAGLMQRKVRIQGRWIPESALFLDNRPQEGKPGFIVLSLLEVGPGVALLVQRGWAPRDRADPRRIPELALPWDGVVEIHGRISHAPSRLMELADEPTGSLRHNVDVGDLSKEFRTGVPPLSIQQTEPMRRCSAPSDCIPDPQDTLLRQWKVVASDPAKNRGYAFQWFSLSALIAGLWVWFQWIQPRRRRHAD